MGLYSDNKGKVRELNVYDEPVQEIKPVNIVNGIGHHYITELVVSSGCRLDISKEKIIFSDKAIFNIDGTTLNITGVRDNTINIDGRNSSVSINMNGNSVTIVNGVITNGSLEGTRMGVESHESEVQENAVKELCLEDFDLNIKRIKLSGQSSIASVEPSFFKDLIQVRLSGQSSFYLNDVIMPSTYFRISGQSKVLLYSCTADSIDIDISGQSKMEGSRIHCNDINKDISGQSKVIMRAD